MDEDNHFLVVVQEKPSPRVVTKPNGTSITKDGIHLMFCIAVDSIYHTYIRDKILDKISNWTLPIINKWEDVVDKAIATGERKSLVLNDIKLIKENIAALERHLSNS